MKVWKMFFLFKWVIFRFHVSFPGCRIEVYLVQIFGDASGMTGMPPTRVLVVFPVGEGKMVVFPETDALIPGDGKMVITYLGSSNRC